MGWKAARRWSSTWTAAWRSCPGPRSGACRCCSRRARISDPVKSLLASDAWFPQVNGVVRTLSRVRAELEAQGHVFEVICPDQFRTIPCPSYPEIRLAILPGRGLARRIEAAAPDAIHIATEGPIGLAVRNYCVKRGLPFTTSYHTRFPEYLSARVPVPLADRKSTRLNSSHYCASRMPSSA